MELSKILVPIGGGRVDEAVVKLACDLARKQKGKVRVVYVIRVQRTLPLEAEVESEVKQADELLAHAELLAQDQGYEVDTDLLQAREIGPAIVDEAVERNVDIIMMGIGYKKRFGEFSLGNVVPYVLKNAPCPVLLLRESIAEEEKP
ncbi:MAG TPA: universal stress protein [Dehalococcoidia bacterium]|nr:universal stress protein [Dehalococcoidia bacterium]